MKRTFALSILALIALPIILSNCNSDDPPKLNIFSIKDDVALGLQTKAEIEADQATYPILDSAQYPAAYQHLYRIRDSILNSGKVKYKDEFPWYMRIIKDDSTLNAFAIPGGYMYFYTGIIKTLDNEAQFAGVMAHEMEHVDRRHATNHLTKMYGVSLLLSVLVGDDPGLLAQIATTLVSLKFTRDNEYESDEYAVRILYETTYNPPSLGDFFVKLEGMVNIPEFLSTHPSPENRVEKINEYWTNLGGKSGEVYSARYTQFKNSLP